jgi:hypothetical protein
MRAEQRLGEVGFGRDQGVLELLVDGKRRA